MMMDNEEVKNLLPHREPFLFIDGVIELQPGVRIVAVRKFRSEEDFFRGHFPGNPIVPGVIVIEALAQAGGILVYSSYPEELKGKTPALVGLENVRFKKPVLPGDEVRLDVQISRGRSRIWKLKGDAFVGETKVAEAEILASVF